MRSPFGNFVISLPNWWEFRFNNLWTKISEYKNRFMSVLILTTHYFNRILQQFAN